MVQLTNWRIAILATVALAMPGNFLPTATATALPSSATVYVSAAKGSDSNAGTGPEAAVRTIGMGLRRVAAHEATLMLLAGRFELNETAKLGVGHRGLAVDQW